MSLALHIKRAFRKLTPAEVAATELAEAELLRMEAQTAQEYAACMVSYHGKRIDRLRAVLAAQADKAAP